MKRYEGMFILDPARCQEDLDGTVAQLRTLLEKHGAAVKDLAKWEDRRLAYEIAGKTRGVFVLGHFECPPESIKEMNRDCGLSEFVLRNLILVDRQRAAILTGRRRDDGQPEQGVSDREPYEGS